MHRVGRVAECAEVLGEARDTRGAVPPVQAREIREGDAGDYTVEIRLERRDERSHVAA